MFTLQKLLTKKMDRKQFLVTLGVITLAVTGISGILKTLKDPELFGVRSNRAKGVFGAGPYGI